MYLNLYLIIYVIIAFFLAIVLYILTYIFSSKNDNYYKLIDYECGFMSYTESKIVFDIQFFIVGLLFIIFDLEIIFLLPWSITISTLGFFGYCTMIFFIFLIIIGFIYEWKKGALSWSTKI